MTEYSHTELNDLLEKYKNGTISESERFLLEKQALDDPFLFDALEGYALHGQQNQKEKVETKIFTLPRIAIAASVIVLFAVMFNLRNEVGQNEMEQTPIAAVLEDEKNDETGLITRDGNKDKTKEVASTASTANLISPDDQVEDESEAIDPLPQKKPSKSPLKMMEKNEISGTTEAVQTVELLDDNSSDDIVLQTEELAPDYKESAVLKDSDLNNKKKRSNQFVSADKVEEVPTTNALSIQVGDSVANTDGIILSRAQPLAKRKETSGSETNFSLAYYEAVPVIGKEIFDDYARQRIDDRGLRQPSPQKVVIEFTIDENGGISNFKHIFSGCSECGAFAIAILQNSGEWKTVPPGFSGKARYTFTF